MKTEVKKIAEENGFDDISKKKEVSGMCLTDYYINLEHGNLFCGTQEEL
jgi:hypothetical protein